MPRASLRAVLLSTLSREWYAATGARQRRRTAAAGRRHNACISRDNAPVRHGSLISILYAPVLVLPLCLTHTISLLAISLLSACAVAIQFAAHAYRSPSGERDKHRLARHTNIFVYERRRATLALASACRLSTGCARRGKACVLPKLLTAAAHQLQTTCLVCERHPG